MVSAHLLGLAILGCARQPAPLGGVDELDTRAEDSGVAGVALPGVEPDLPELEQQVVSPRPWVGPVELTDVSANAVTEIQGIDDYCIDLGRWVDVVPDVTGDGLPELASRRVTPSVGWIVDLRSGVRPEQGDNPPPTVSRGVAFPDDNAGMFIPLMFTVPGDLDGDEYADLLVGDWYYWTADSTLEPPPPSGSVLVLPGPVESGDIDPGVSSAWLYSREESVGYIGTSSAVVGDQDQDGNADFALGSGIRPMYHTSGEAAGQSKAWIVDGPLSGRMLLEDVAHAVVDMSVYGWVRTGARVTDTGDLDGDGIADLAIGGPFMPVVGALSGGVVVLHGPIEGSLTWEEYDALLADVGGEGVSTNLGYALAGELDTNGDGYLDLWVGAPGYQHLHDDGDAFEYGAASLVEGPFDGDVHMADQQTALVASGDWYSQMGSSMDALGDVDGDGLDDVAIGAPDQWKQPGTGAVTVAYGGIEGYHISGLGTESVDLALLYGDNHSRYLGHAVAGGEDLDQDGWPDLVIGDPYYDTGDTKYTAGRIFVAFGGPKEGGLPDGVGIW